LKIYRTPYPLKASMNKRNKIILSSIIITLLLLSTGFILHKLVVSWRWQNAAEAAGGLPYQIGLTNAVLVPCVVSCNGGCCSGGTLCTVKAPGICTTYQTVSGSPAGGMGNMALFSNLAIAKAGLTQGGQLIAGGMTLTEMDQGVLASSGGCYGCVAKSGMRDKIFSWLEKLDNFIIAGFKGK